MASDAAFLAMDLDCDGRPDLARYFASQMVAAIGIRSAPLQMFSFHFDDYSFFGGAIDGKAPVTTSGQGSSANRRSVFGKSGEAGRGRICKISPMRTEKLRARRSVRPPWTGTKHGAFKPVAAPSSAPGNSADSLGQVSTANRSAVRVPAKWRWHYRVLLSLQSRLLRERRELRRAATEPLEPHSLDEADSATDEFDHNLALTQLSVEQDALYEVNAALHRIATGTYGVCEVSGKPIPAARLEAIPWTRFTRAVEQQLEERGAMDRTRLREAGTVRDEGRTWLAPEAEAEENSESPAATDEALPYLFSPSGQPVTPQAAVRRRGGARKQKDGSA